MNLTKTPYGQKEVDEAMELWDQLAENYRRLEDDYEKILEEASRVGVKTSIKKPPASTKVDFYQKYVIPFLLKETYEEAEEYLEGLKPQKISVQTQLAKDMSKDFYYVTKRNIIKELKNKIKNKETAGKTMFLAPQAQKL